MSGVQPQRLAFWGVVALTAVLLLVRAGSVPLLDPDESRFARTSVEMLRNGDPVVPTFQGEPRLAKPPLAHWIQSAVFSLAGPREWAARLHAAVSTLGSVLILGWLAGRRFGPEGRVWAAAIFSTMPLVLVPGRVGTLDALLAVHVLAVVVLDMAGETIPAPSRAILAGALLGLGFLAKGPAGVLLPLLVMLAGRTATRQELPGPRAACLATAAWAAVVLPWGLALIRRVGVDEVARMIRVEVFERYFGGTSHPEPAWFFVPVAAIGCLPWLGPLLLGAGRAWSERHDPVARSAIYAAAGLAAGFVFFSLGQGKVASYVLPLAPLAAIVVTWELGREIAAPRQRTLGPLLVALTLASGALLLWLAAVPRLAGAPRTTAAVGGACYAAGAVVAMTGAARHRPRWTYAAAAAASGALLLGCVMVLLPDLGRTHSAAELIEAVPELEETRPVVTVEVRVPSLTFYLDRIVEPIEMRHFEEHLSRADRPVFVLAQIDLPSVPATVASRLVEIGRSGKYAAFRAEP